MGDRERGETEVEGEERARRDKDVEREGGRERQSETDR